MRNFLAPMLPTLPATRRIARSIALPIIAGLLVALLGGAALSPSIAVAQPPDPAAPRAKAPWLERLEEGFAAQRRGDFAGAMAAFDAARALAESANGEEDLSVAACLQAYGEVALQLSLLDEAEAAIARVLSIRESRLGRVHSEVAQAIAAQAQIERARGNSARAVELLDQALTIQIEAVGRLHPVTGMLQLRRGAILVETGEYREAEIALNNALRTWDTLGPEYAGESAQTLNNLTSIMMVQQRYDQADVMLRRVLRITQQQYGATSVQTAGVWANIGVVAAAAGNEETAEEAMRRALTLYEEIYGGEHPLIAQTLDNMAEFYRKNGMTGRALTLSTRATTMYAGLLGDTHPRTIASKQIRAALLRETGATEEAAALEAELAAAPAAASAAAAAEHDAPADGAAASSAADASPGD
jgi:tetratricopeptide (TPR) repeat protein